MTTRPASQGAGLLFLLLKFYNFHTFITTQLFNNISYIHFVLIVNYFSSILWCEDDMIFAHPFRMCKWIFFLRHKLPFFLQYSLNNFIVNRKVIFFNKNSLNFWLSFHKLVNVGIACILGLYRHFPFGRYSA